MGPLYAKINQNLFYFGNTQFVRNSLMIKKTFIGILLFSLLSGQVSAFSFKNMFSFFLGKSATKNSCGFFGKNKKIVLSVTGLAALLVVSGYFLLKNSGDQDNPAGPDDFEVEELKNDLKNKISENFDLDITNPSNGSMMVLVEGYDKDADEDDNFNPVDIDFSQMYRKHKVSEDLTDFICNYRGYGKKSNGFERTKRIIADFSNNFSRDFFSGADKKIVYAGFGTYGSDKEFATLFAMVSDNQDHNVLVQDIHLIDPAYNSIIEHFSRKNEAGRDNSFGTYRAWTGANLKKMDKKCTLYGSMSAQNFKKIIDYFYLLNKQTKAEKNSIRLFFHRDVHAYLSCVEEQQLKKANIISSWYPIKIGNMMLDQINLIKNGTENDCLFLGYLDEKEIHVPKKLNLQTIDKYVNDISQNMHIRGITKEDFLKEAEKM